jgi:hypothetical protein
MPKYQPGDYVKVEFKDENQVGEWMWVIVDHADDQKRIVYGRLDNQSITDARLIPGTQLAISYDKVREHAKPHTFRK